MKRLAILLPVLALLLMSAPDQPVSPVWAGAPDTAPASLFEQSASAILRRDFAGPQISYLLLDARSGRVLAQRWDHPEQPIPIGSLVKPFTAVAYARTHGSRFPDHTCVGGATCWLPRGHGSLDLRHAIAYSCNSYFRALASDIHPAEAAAVFRQFGLETPPAGATREQLVGLDESWAVAPLRLARAYLELAAHPLDSDVREVLAGMADSARLGTGAGVGRPGLAKTGTAACTHGSAPGDGFVVALVPAEAPTLLLMVRVHGVPGSRAAVTAGQMLRRLSDTGPGAPRPPQVHQ